MHKRVSFVRTANELPHTSINNSEQVCATCRYAFEDTHLETQTYTNPLSLDRLLIQHPAATYFITVGKDERIAVSDNTYLGVEQGDILTIDRALRPSVGRLVLIVHNGSFRLCRFTEHKGEAYVIWGDTADASEPFTDESSITVWGVVSALSRRV